MKMNYINVKFYSLQDHDDDDDDDDGIIKLENIKRNERKRKGKRWGCIKQGCLNSYAL